MGKNGLTIAGNWKMFKTSTESAQFIRELKDKLKDANKVKVVICPPFSSISVVKKELNNSKVFVGAQNCHWDEQGAYTGEISARMLSDLGCEYVIIGHSERRNYFRETDELINMKLKQALGEQLTPIFCVGETWQEREAGNTEKIIETQLKKGLAGINNEEVAKIIVAYEPVWAIGSGKNATPEQARQAHQFIRKYLGELYGPGIAENTSILYGGSVSPENAKDLFEVPEINGALVGGASLEADTFLKIISAARN
ncbi:MAG: triose-phosphate isomerase [candidate division Zixibacteria bacterium]|nr:triose-phosphate isomerase [candidate division Zixibacteria bacterium]